MYILLRLARGCARHTHKSLAACQTVTRAIPAGQAASRSYSDGAGLVKLEKEEGFSILHMNRAPVNSLATEFLQEITDAILEVEGDRKMQGLILTSGCPKIFSAGLDIMEMYQKSPESTDKFWFNLQEMWMTLYDSRLATIAAINGHSPAGGCAMAMSCDYRIMAEGPYSIGLNEVHLGIVAPFWFKDVMLNTIGHRETERALGLGIRYSTEEALRIGMVDELAPEAQVLDKAKEEIQKWIKIPGVARMASKRMIREATLSKLRDIREDDINMFTNFIQMDSVQKHLGKYLESLKKK